MSVLDAFLWLGQTPLGLFLKGSTLAFAFTEAAHLLGLALVGGAVIAADLAVLGGLFRRVAPGAVVQGARGVFWSGLALVVASGISLVAAGPFKYYSNPLFPVKLALLALALVVQVLLLLGLRADEPRPSGQAKVLAAASLALWLSVLIAGRWLGLI